MHWMPVAVEVAQDVTIVALVFVSYRQHRKLLRVWREGVEEGRAQR